MIATLLLAPSAALAQANMASLYVVQGIPGRDLASTLDPTLPLDVLVGGRYCLVQGLAFGGIAGPFVLQEGSYTIDVSLADPLAPCSNSAVFSTTATLSGGTAEAVVAALGSSGAPAAELYPIDESPVTAGRQRLVMVHAANAGTFLVQVSVPGKTSGGGKFLLSAGTQKTFQFPQEQAFEVEERVSGSVLGPLTVSPGNAGVGLIVAVGSGSSGSATLISKIIPNVY